MIRHESVTTLQNEALLPKPLESKRRFMGLRLKGAKGAPLTMLHANSEPQSILKALVPPAVEEESLQVVPGRDHPLAHRRSLSYNFEVVSCQGRGCFGNSSHGWGLDFRFPTMSPRKPESKTFAPFTPSFPEAVGLVHQCHGDAR